MDTGEDPRTLAKAASHERKVNGSRGAREGVDVEFALDRGKPDANDLARDSGGEGY